MASMFLLVASVRLCQNWRFCSLSVIRLALRESALLAWRPVLNQEREKPAARLPAHIGRLPFQAHAVWTRTSALYRRRYRDARRLQAAHLRGQILLAHRPGARTR